MVINRRCKDQQDYIDKESNNADYFINLPKFISHIGNYAINQREESISRLYGYMLSTRRDLKLKTKISGNIFCC